MPVHHKLEEYLDAYLAVLPDVEDSPAPLLRTSDGRGRPLTSRPMNENVAWKMVKRRAKNAGLTALLSNHSFRGTGITNYLKNGGTLAEAQKMAGHADPRTTKLYDRTGDAPSLDEVERITI